MSETRTIFAADGVGLQLEWWLPEGAPRFVVAISHGLGEHGSRYGDLAKRLCALGGLCVAVDHRGQGSSEGTPGHIDGFEQYTDDFYTALGVFSDSLPEPQRPDMLPWFLFGHSMGGLIVLTYLLDHEDDFPLAGAILSAPFLALAAHIPFAKRLLAKVGGVLAPRLAVSAGIDSASISRDPEVVRAYDADTRRVTVVTPGWHRSLEQAQRRVKSEVRCLRLPMLWYAGTGDVLVDHRATKNIFDDQVAASASATGHELDRELRLFEGYFHEAHNEPPAERERVYEMLETWICARVMQEAEHRE